jgi:hypothetical protein
MADNQYTKALYDQLNPKLDLGEYSAFEKKLWNDNVFRKAIYDEASTDLELGDFGSFEGNVKKKASPLELASQGQTVFQELGQPLNEPSPQASPLTSVEPVQKTEAFTSLEQAQNIEQPPAKKDRTTSAIGDALRSLKSGSLTALGGITGTPQFLNRTVAAFTTRPFIKAMGGTDEDAKIFTDAILAMQPTGQVVLGGAQIQEKLNKAAAKTEAKLFPIEGNIVQNIQKGEWGHAGELLVRGIMQSAPYLAMTMATAGGGSAAVLGTIGATAASQQYAQLEGKKESKKLLNAWLYGGFEAAGELVTAGLANGIGRAFKAGVIKEVDENFIKGAAKQVAKSFGLEGSSEAATQIGQNISDIITGVDPNRRVMDNVLDAGLIGGVSGAGLGNVHIAAAIIGRTLASDEEVSQVQDNHKQQEVLIDQIETTDNDPVKTALESRLKNLKLEAEQITDVNYALAEKLTPVQKAKVASLYAVWNSLQAKIDSGEISEQEITTIENTIKGVKDEIQTIKDDLIAEEEGKAKEKEQKAKEKITETGVEEFKLGDKTFNSKEELISWLDKNYNEQDRFDSVNEEGYLEPNTMKVFNEWYKTNKNRLSNEELERLQKEQLKLEEEKKNAESRGTGTEESSQQARELEQGEEERIRLRDNEKTRLEAEQREEVDNKLSTERDQAWTNTKLAEIQAKGDLIEGTRLDEILKNGKFALLTGENPNNTPHTEAQNKVFNENAKAWLEKENLKFYELTGFYGSREASLLVPDMTVEQAKRFAVDLKQESVATDEGLVYQDGSIRKRIPTNDVLVEGNIGENDVHSAIPVKEGGVKKFAMGYDWDNLTPPPVDITPSATITPQEGIGAPPESMPPAEGDVKETEREKALLNRMHDAEKLSPEFKEGVGKKGLDYEQIPNEITAEEVDYLIADKGTRESERAVYNTGNDMPPRVRGLAATRLIKTLDSFADMAAEEGDTKSEYEYRKRAIEMADFIDKTAREWGRGIQIFNSAEVNDVLAPKTQVIRVKKEVRRQRDTQIESNKKDITTKAKSMRKANETSIDEAMTSKIYNKAKDTVTGKPKPSTVRDVSIPKEKIKQEQEYRKTQWDVLKKPSGTASVSAIGLNKEQIEAIGNIIASYVREGYYRTEVLAKKLSEDWKKHTGEDLSIEEATKMIPKQVEGKSIEELQAQGEEIEASTLLSNRVMRMLKDPSVPKDDPIKQMVETLFKKIEEKDTKEKVKPERKTDAEKIKEALTNKEQYAEVWEAAKEEVKDRIESNEEISEEQKEELNSRLDGFYEEIIGKPFSEKETKGATKKALKDMDVSIDKVVRDHYTVYDATKRSLQEKLIEELGLTGEDAKMLADAVGKEFDKIAIARKRAILKQGVTAKEVVKAKTAKQVHEKLIELSNMGAFSDAEFAEAYADKWGFPKLEPEQTKEIERLAKAVQDAPEGETKFERVQDLLAYVENIKGIDMGDVYMSMWYSSILSGYRTQGKNFIQNSITSLFEGAVSTIRHPLYAHRLVQGLTSGWGEGLRQFSHIMKTGYNPIKGYKIEVPSTQERFSFKGGNANPANWGKYVTRLMVAADAFSYAGLKEMRSYEIAMNEARKINKNALTPTGKTWAIATELLNKTSDRVAIAEHTATSEGLIGAAHKRRVWELMEQGREKAMIEDAAHFAAKGTFNYSPEGILGMMTETVSHLTQNAAVPIKVPFSDKKITVRPGKFIIPFTRIIANVTNMALDYYPPIGLARAAAGGIGSKGFEISPITKKFYRQYTPEERQKVLIKAMIGTAAYLGMYLLTEPDDDGKSAVEITANGYGDYQKNYELKETGWQPYSIRIGDEWVSYQYTPLILALAPLGYLRDTQKYSKEKIKEDRLATQIGLSFFKGMGVITDMTWASSLNSLMQAFTAKEPTQAKSFLVNLTASTAKGFIYPKLAEQITQVIDQAQKNPRHDAKDLVGKIMRDIPIVRNNYNDMLNAIGEPVVYDAAQMLGKAKRDPFWEYITDKNVTIGKPNAKQVFYDDVTKTERAMTNQEYYDFVKISGPEIKRRIEEEVMSKNISDDDAKKAISQIKTDVRAMTNVEMFGWGELRSKYPEDWKLMKNNEALQLPRSSQVIVVGKEKIRIGEKSGVPSKELEEFNNTAMDEYRRRVINYLKNTEKVARDKVKLVPDKDISVFEEKIGEIWTNAIGTAKTKMGKTMREQKK